MSSTKNVETIEKRISNQGSGAVLSAGLHQDGSLNNTGMSPRNSSVPEPTISVGGGEIETFGEDLGLDFDHGSGTEPERVYEMKTPGGHIIERNDTSGQERIMIKHASGVGINIGPDGTVLVSSTNRVDICNKSYTFSLTGDGKLTYHGNLDLQVDGDYNVNVGGNYNITALSRTENIKGPAESHIKGDMLTTVIGNQSAIITGGGTNQYLTGLNTIVKGDSVYAVNGSHTMSSSDTLTMTSENEVVITSVKTHIAGDTVSLIGSSGTIGGENVIAYVKNIYGTSGNFSARVKAPVFEGDLDGNALTATTAGTSLHQSYDDGTYVSSSGTGVSPGSYTAGLGTDPGYTVDDTEIDETATEMPTAALLADYKISSKGIKVVLVDPNNDIKNNLDLSVKTGGVSNSELDVTSVRSKLRDPAHRNNPEFIAYAQSLGVLSPDYVKTTPSNINNVSSVKNIVIQGDTPIGNASAQYNTKRVRAT